MLCEIYTLNQQSPMADRIICSSLKGIKDQNKPNCYAMKGMLSLCLFCGRRIQTDRLHLFRLLTISICFHFVLFSPFYKEKNKNK